MLRDWIACHGQSIEKDFSKEDNVSSARKPSQIGLMDRQSPFLLNPHCLCWEFHPQTGSSF